MINEIMRTKVSLGIDIGGTNIAYGVIDREGECVLIDSKPIKSFDTPQALIAALRQDIERRLDTRKFQLIGVGTGAPSGNYFAGTIENTANLNWEGRVPFVELTKKEFGLPAFITNDAKASALGEMVYGGAKGMRNFVVITLGTGLGSGIVVNGQLVYGHDGLAGEVGHTIVASNGRACGCGRRGCLEAYASATGIKRTAGELLATENMPSRLRDVPFNELSSKMICDAANEGDPIALETFRFTGEVLGTALANLTAILRPEAIFLQGGAANAGELLFKPTREYMEKNMLFLFKEKVRILPSSLPSNAAIYGAAALVWNELKQD